MAASLGRTVKKKDKMLRHWGRRYGVSLSSCPSHVFFYFFQARVLLNINSQTFKLYNQYLTAMVGCLWTSQAFTQDPHPQGIKMSPEVLEMAGVASYKRAFNIVFHPALMAFSFSFLHQVSTLTQPNPVYI